MVKGDNKMKKQNLNKFVIPACCIAAVMIVLIALYFLQFHGDLSSDSSDWNNWANYVGEIGTFLFTGLNLYVFCILTIQMNSTNKLTTQFHVQSVIIEKIGRLITPIQNIVTYKSSDYELFQQLYLYMAWAKNYENLFNHDIERQRNEICKMLEYFVGKDKNGNVLPVSASTDNPNKVASNLLSLKHKLLCLESDLPQTMMDIVLEIEKN